VSYDAPSPRPLLPCWLQLVDVGGPDATPPAVRLRLLLKIALRSFGLKAKNITQTPPAGAEPETPDHGRATLEDPAPE
jgi:hypothetical protein